MTSGLFVDKGQNMEFVKLAKKHLKRRTTTPKKLPTHQLTAALKSTKTVSQVNCLLKYSVYSENYEEPSEVMASIMLKRLVLLIRDRSLEQRSVKGWNQMKKSVSFLTKAKISSVREKWQLAIIVVIIKIHCDENEDDVKLKAWMSDFDKSNKWGIQFNEDKGRHVFAKSDIEEGEIVSIDQVPLFKLLYDPLLGEENEHGSTKLQTSHTNSVLKHRKNLSKGTNFHPLTPLE